MKTGNSDIGGTFAYNVGFFIDRWAAVMLRCFE